MKAKLFGTILVACLVASQAKGVENIKRIFDLEAKVFAISEKTLSSLTNELNDSALAYQILSDEKVLDRLLGDPDTTVFSSPNIRTTEGQEALMQIKSDLQYMERKEDGSFLLKKVPPDDTPGFRINVTLAAEEEDKNKENLIAVKINFIIDLIILERRLPIPGVTLDIGTPIMQYKRRKLEGSMPCNRWILFYGTPTTEASGKKEHILVAFRIQVTADRAISK